MVEARSKPVSQDSSRIRFENIFEQIDLNQRKTSIISTLGQSSNDLDSIGKMLDAGANILRLDFSIGDHKVGEFEHCQLANHFSNFVTVPPIINGDIEEA